MSASRSSAERQVSLHDCSVRLTGADEAILGRWDKTRLEQIIGNLLSNAIKYGAGKPIDVTVARTGTHATVSIQDRGIGIAPEHLVRIFDRFERAASIRSYGGLGLGLYVAREIITAHGGTLRVESSPGEGSTFVVSLPLAETPV